MKAFGELHSLSTTSSSTTVVPALGDPRRERPPAVYGHSINAPTHFKVPIRPSDERPPAMYGHFCLVPRVSVHDRYYCIPIFTRCMSEDFNCRRFVRIDRTIQLETHFYTTN